MEPFKYSGRELGPLFFCLLVFSQASMLLLKGPGFCLLNISAMSTRPPTPGISSIINVLTTHHRAICDGLWLAVRGASSKFTTASSRDEGWGQRQGCGGGMGTQAALPPSCLSAKWGYRGQRASRPLLRLVTAAKPAQSVGSVQPELEAPWGPEVSWLLETEGDTLLVLL